MTVFSLYDLELEVDDAHLSEPIERGLTRGWYEVDEVGIIRSAVKPGDRVIDIGAGLGVTAMVAARITGADAVCAYEANPALIGMLKRNLKRNGLELAVENAILLPRAQAAARPSMRLHLGDQFWGSSVLAKPETKSAGATDVPTRCLEDVVVAHRANVLVMDIEGLEVEIMESADLSAIETLIVEIHYNIAGRKRTNQAILNLIGQGFDVDFKQSNRGVLLLTRAAA